MSYKKTYLISIVTVLLLLVVGCKEKPPRYIDETEKITTLKFDKTLYNFGTIKSGQLVKVTFKVINTGKNNLVITDAVATCGCTIPNWTKKPIKPGAYGKLYVVYNSEGRKGFQTKDVTIFVNTLSGKARVRLKGFVKK